jgi:hypothetical protein
MSSETICPICPICYENIGKIHRVLHCGHKFHHKCLKLCEINKADKHNCPYCRQEYENIVLRERKTLLTIEEKKCKTEFVMYIKKKLNECEITVGKKNKFLICNSIYKKIIEKKNMILTPKFGFMFTFTKTVRNKVSEIYLDIQELFKNGEITNEYYEFCGYKDIIMRNF